MRAAPLVLTALLLSSSLLGCDALLPEYPREPPPGVEPPAVGEASDADPNEERLTLRAGRRTFRDVRLDGERLWGPRHEIGHFADGYRGKSPWGVLFLSQEKEGYVSGVIGWGALTNVTYKEDPVTHRIVSEGRWAERPFGLELGRDEIVVNGRFCSDVYRRLPNTDVFRGKPECWQAGRYGADIHIPEVFFKRPPGEQVIFLSAFLS